MRFLVVILVLSMSQAAWAGPDEIDPFADARISCDEVREFPEKIFTDDIDLGSGHGSPVEVDYGCKGGAAALPYLQNLISLAEAIRQEEPSECTGSIVYAHWRYYNFRLLMAGTAPRQFLEARIHLTPPSALEAYFSTWAIETPSNYRIHQAFLQARSEAQPLLLMHYQEQFGMSREEAESITSKLLAMVSMRAAGSFPGSSYESVTSPKTLFPLAASIAFESPDLPAIKLALASKPSQVEIDQALKLALLRQLPLEIIAELTFHLNSLDSGDESAVFFSLKNPDALELLLSRGASVDYANSFGKTALFYAIESGDRQTVAALLEHGANPNHAYKNADELERLQCITHNIRHSSRTPLMHAAQHSDPAMLTLLLDKGARLNDVDGLGWDALDYAMENQQQANAEFLRSKGATPASALGD